MLHRRKFFTSCDFLHTRAVLRTVAMLSVQCAPGISSCAPTCAAADAERKGQHLLPSSTVDDRVQARRAPCRCLQVCHRAAATPGRLHRSGAAVRVDQDLTSNLQAIVESQAPHACNAPRPHATSLPFN